MSTVRLRRLAADFKKLKDYVRQHPRVRLIQYEGDPPEQYQLEYRIRSLRQVDGELKTVTSHIVEITLPRNYPRTPPQCRMLSPVFHPNIAPHAVCIGDHWSAGESLQGIVTRIGEMLAWQSYNVKSPLNGEAARWAEENQESLPLDPVSLLPEDEREQSPASPAVRRPKQSGQAAGTGTAVRKRRPAAGTETAGQEAARPRDPARKPRPAAAETTTAETTAAAEPEGMTIECPNCESRYRLPPGRKAAKVRCRRCMHVFEVA